MNTNTFTTKTGLVLPLLNLKGKDYLDVASRVLWFRTEHPLGRIESEPVQITDTFSIFKATISIPDDKGEYVKLSDGYKREDAKHFADHIEKSSTGAIGRALALCGYGTQFTHELNEEHRIVDTPRPQLTQPTRIPSNAEIHLQEEPFFLDEGKAVEPPYIIGFGKYKGRPFNGINPKELIEYAEYIVGKARAQGESITNRDTMYFLDRVKQLRG